MCKASSAGPTALRAGGRGGGFRGLCPTHCSILGSFQFSFGRPECDRPTHCAGVDGNYLQNGLEFVVSHASAGKKARGWHTRLQGKPNLRYNRSMAVIHISRAEAAGDFDGLLALAANGDEVFIEANERVVARLLPADAPRPRLLSESLKIIKPRGSVVTLDSEPERRLDAEEWSRELHAWIHGNPPNTPVLSDEAISRESIYGTRGL
jgi:antitoxin (DNA-binding transcriptional repressor) of toxin-antitoxin stability system